MSTHANEKRSVLILAYVFPPFFSTGGSIRAIKFIKYLARLGWRPVALTIDDSRETVSQRKTGSEALLREVPPEVKIYRTRASGEPSVEFIQKGREARRKNRVGAAAISLLSAIRRFAMKYLMLPDEQITWLPYAVSLGRRVIRDENIDIIFATSPPHSDALIGSVLKRLTGKPLILDYRDDWIDTPFHRSKPSLVQWVERQMERWAVRTADRVVLVTDWSRDAFLKRYPDQPAEKFLLIPNGCDLKDWMRPGVAPLADPNRFTIVHAGLLSTDEEWTRDPEGFFEALRRVAADRPDVGAKLRVQFTGRLPDRYCEMVARMVLTDVVEELGYLPLEELIARLKGADLLLAINYDDFETLIPGKIYEYWAIGGPPILLLSTPGAAQSLIARHNLGTTVSAYDPRAIAEAIVSFFESPSRIDTAGIEEYDREALARRLAVALDDLYESKRTRRVAETAAA